MMRRAALAGLLALAACAPGLTVTDVIEQAPLPQPLTPALLVPSVMLPQGLAERERRGVQAQAALGNAIGERPTASPGTDAALAGEARARGLPRVVLLSVVQAAPEGTGTSVAIRVRVVDARSGQTIGHVTRWRRTQGLLARRGESDLGAEIEALARDLLR